MDRDDVATTGLSALGLTTTEAAVYVELLRKPATHAQLSVLTGINRTTLYRLVRKLEQRGLVTQRLDDRGKFLVAAHPSTLEVEVLTQEQLAKRQRTAFTQVMPLLESIQEGYAADFAIHTYEGIDGFKRMLWHELKTVGECLCIGGAALEELGVDQRWAEKHRQRTIEAGYHVRELANPGVTPDPFTDNETFLRQYYQLRIIRPDVLPINHLITIYNDTVATYNVYEGRHIGLEVVSKTYVQTFRAVFEQFWQVATPHPIKGQ
jgi:hypothetical protein